MLENFMPIMMAAADGAAAAAADGAAEGSEGFMVMLIQLLPFILMIVIFYFLFMRPQKKKEKKDAEMRQNLQVGDEVATVGGIIGIVVRRNDDNVVIETGGDRSRIRVKLWAIQENMTIHDDVESSK